VGPSARALALSLAGSLALLACPSSPEHPAAPATEPRAGLRVGLPDGWKATPSGGGLDVGPKGRVVLQLESLPQPLPSPDDLARRLEAQEVRITQKDMNDVFVGLRYSLVLDGGGGEGFVGVKRVGARTVWCATTAQATSADVSEAMGVCRGVGADPPGP
jgi:hypothetical protein